MTTFIYALKEPDTGEIRYVGKSDSPKERLFVHLADKARNHRTNWIKSLCGKPILEILDEVPVEHWQQWEVAYIEFFREQGCNLVNGTPGGEGGRFWTGKKIPVKTREKMSAARMGKYNGKDNPFFGKKHSLDARSKISASRKDGRYAGEKNPNFGKKASPGKKEKMSVSQTLRWEKYRQEKVLAEMWR